MQIDPTVPRNIEYALWQQRTIGNHWAAVRCQLDQPTDELLIPRTLRLQDLKAQLSGPPGYGAGGKPLATAARGIRPGYHCSQLVMRLRQRIQGRDRNIGGAAKDDSHRRSLGGLVGTGVRDRAAARCHLLHIATAEIFQLLAKIGKKWDRPLPGPVRG